MFVLKPEQIKAVVLDDAPLDYDKFSLGTKVLVGNYVKGSIFLSREERQKYNNILWVDSNYPDPFLLGSEYYVDMREMDAALTSAGVEHALVDPLAERNLQMKHNRPLPANPRPGRPSRALASSDLPETARSAGVWPAGQ